MNSNQQHLEQFCTLLNSLTNENDAIRTQAETQINSVPIDNRVQLLLHTLSSQANQRIKNVACVTLKMIFQKGHQQNEISEQSFLMAKSCLPQLVVNEENDSLRKKLVSLLTSLIEIYRVDGVNTWDESVSFIANCITSPEPRMQEIALNIIIYLPSVFGDKIKQLLPQLTQFLLQCLQNFQTNPKKSVLSIEALSMLAEECEDKSSIHMLSKLTPSLLTVTQMLVPTENGNECMAHMTCLLECHPRLFKNFTEQVVEVLLGLLKCPYVEHIVSFDVFEGLVSYVQKVPGAIKKYCSKYIPAIIDHAYQLLTVIDEEELSEWFVQYDECTDENLSESAYFGETSLDRLACALKGEIVLPLVLTKVNEYLQNPDWRYQDAAVVSLGAVAEGCRKQMKPMLPQIVKTLAPYFSSNNPKIVYSVINTIGQMSTDFPGYFHNNYHAQVFPPILKVAESHNFIKVQSQAVFAFINIIDGCNDELLDVYFNNMCQILIHLSATISRHLNVDGVFLLIRAVTNAIMHLCERLEGKFEPYVASLIPNLFSIVEQIVNVPHFHRTMAQLLDCLVVVTSSYNSETADPFLPSIIKYVEMFNKLCENSPDKDELQLRYYSLLTKLADVGSRHLTPILPSLVPTLLNFLSKDNEESSNNMNQLSSEPDYESSRYYYNEELLNDKCTVCELISSLAENLKNDFSQYVEVSLQVLLILFTKYTGHNILIYITDCIPSLLNCLVLSGNTAYALNVWGGSVKNTLLISIKDDPNEEIFGELLENFARCITYLGSDCLNPTEIKYIGEVFNARILSLLQYDDQLSQAKVLKGDDDDDEIYDDSEVEQMYLNDIILQSIQSCIHDIFKVFKNSFVNAIDPMYKTLMLCLDTKRSDMYIRFAFCIFDDIVEFVPQSAQNCCNDFVPKMLHYLSSTNPDMRQVTSYGLGLVAQAGIAACYNYLSQSIPLLVRHISDPESNNPDNITATANCVATYGRYIRYIPQLFGDPTQEIRNWLQLLPITADEVDFCLDYLCEIIENQPNLVFQNNNDQHNSKIIHALIAMLLECDDNNVCKKTVSTILKLQNVFSTQITQSLNSLDDVERATFDRIFKNNQ